jgi:hypothetical protein
MTLEELAHTLPSGFHDSALKGLSIDYERRTLQLNVSLKVGDPDGPREQRDDIRDAEVEIYGVVFFVIDPPCPDPAYDFVSAGEVWIGDGCETRSIPKFTEGINAKLLNAVPEGAFVQSFFVHDWNSFVHVAARDCAIKWLGVARHYKGPRQILYPGEMVDL